MNKMFHGMNISYPVNFGDAMLIADFKEQEREKG